MYTRNCIESSNLSFTATLSKHRPPIFLEKVGGLWFLASEKGGHGVGFAFENSERMADFMRRCKGKVMVRENDHPDIRRVFEGFQFEAMDIRYSTASQRQGKVSGELVIMNWVSEDGDVVLI